MLPTQIASGDSGYALAVALVIAFIYLAVVRALDLNEKEPLWAIGMVLGIGALAGVTLYLTVSSTVLELSLWGGVLAKEVTKALALAAAFAVLGAIARMRGWSEVNGVLDGIVYGATAGLGLAVGAVFVREMLVGGSIVGGQAGGGLTTLALSGMSEGVFGAIIGAGFGAAVEARERISAIALPLLGLVVAVVAHVGYEFMRTGASLSAAGVALKWTSLLLPVALLAVAVVYSIVREKRAIAEELADEAGAGVVSAEELALLRSFTSRRSAYLRHLMKGDINGWSTLRELHNRQVQLALTERRYRRTSDPDRRGELLNAVQRLRVAILELKSTAPSGSAPAAAVSTEA